MQSLAWRDPAETLAPFAEEAYAALLLSDGAPGARWSYLARNPDQVDVVSHTDPDRDFSRLARLLGPHARRHADGPPFQGGVIALIAYEFADRLEVLNLSRDPDWADLTLCRYPALLAFDHHQRRILAIGRGDGAKAAQDQASLAAGWLDAPPITPRLCKTPAHQLTPLRPGSAYETAVRDVTGRIAAGEIFQANIAQTWTGRLHAGADPFAVFDRLQAGNPAPFSAYLRLPGLALVSHSPEQFVAIAGDGQTAVSRPIKGTRPRGDTSACDAALASALLASDKERAENLMIVDLVRNDFSRVCEPGTVKVPSLFALESYPSMHHLVSTVTGRLSGGNGPAELLSACFPPGSITGAPKIQAMKVIAGHEPPRGPWCGALAWVGFDGAMESSVLIRTAAFVQDAAGWQFRATAGAGIVADSEAVAERLETEIKFSGLRAALMGLV